MSTNWEFEECTIVHANEEHMALLFLCDISGSMNDEVAPGKQAIDLLNDALSGFAPAVRADPKSARILDVGIVAFDHTQQLAQNFTPVSQMNFKPLSTAGGGTKIAAAAQFAVDMLNAHVKHFTNAGVAVRKPWILMVTDGRPDHDTPDELDKAVSRVKDLDAKGKLRFWSFGVGNFDRSTLERLSGDRAFALEGYNFGTMIDWAVKSMRTISTAATGEAPPAPIDQSQGMKQIVQIRS